MLLLPEGQTAKTGKAKSSALSEMGEHFIEKYLQSLYVCKGLKKWDGGT
jgi:hypothetical protein